jgi:hypothetical protein
MDFEPNADQQAILEAVARCWRARRREARSS